MNDFESFLNSYFCSDFSSDVLTGMKYSLLDGGKRLRPQLLLGLLNDYGVAEKIGYEAALALEMIHTYSLIHDDLPAMDNDSLRRGKPSNHIQFGEATAILAGDALLTEAFACLCGTQTSQETVVEISRLLSAAAGYRGMIYGQELDLKGEKLTYSLQQVRETNYYKTSALFIVALKMAATLAQKKDDYDTLEVLGASLGIAFQIHDDILEVELSAEQLGKSKSDSTNHKSTYLSVLGVEQAKTEMKTFYQNARDCIEKLDLISDNLLNIICEMEKRQK